MSKTTYPTSANADDRPGLCGRCDHSRDVHDQLVADHEFVPADGCADDIPDGDAVAKARVVLARLGEAIEADGRPRDEIAVAAGISPAELEATLHERRPLFVAEVVLLSLVLGFEASTLFARDAVPDGVGRAQVTIALHCSRCGRECGRCTPPAPPVPVVCRSCRKVAGR
ncbi:hypothetical protein [Nocardia sp. BMG51109]|uniref:hypothetical protein n=1 Tax=Nocardia sp. BMG51109 TaxID=1056816 RepID=UPI0012ECAB38|nr:hypothetical protein [Nocardia sp. BMG51109]